MTRMRRLTLAAVALTATFTLLHGQLAAAVVTRGDDALRAGDVDGAIRLYRARGVHSTRARSWPPTGSPFISRCCMTGPARNEPSRSRRAR